MDEITRVVQQLRGMGYRLSIEFLKEDTYVVRVIDKFGVVLSVYFSSILGGVREVSRRLMLDRGIQDMIIEESDMGSSDDNEW